MKKIYITLIMGILLVGLIGALTLSVYTNKNKELSSNDKILFDKYNISGYGLSPIICNTETCEPIRLKIDGVVEQTLDIIPYRNRCTEWKEVFEDEECIEWEKTYYTNTQLESHRDSWEDAVISKAINYLNEKEAKELLIDEEKVPGIDVTITKRK